MSLPLLSVVVPARDAGTTLGRCLAALAANDLPRARWELVVVDDGSTDDTARIATRYADVVLCTSGRSVGPAAARNRGVAACRADIVVFVDADVCVHRSTLRRFHEILTRAADVAAVSGAYDTAPADRGFMSQYRNLLHHRVHATHGGAAETFWTGCGAVRRSAFLDVGGFDARRYPRPQIEDIELGYRLRDRGYRLELRPDVQGTHLKRWTFRGMLVTDVRDRGIPWMRLLLERRRALARGPLNVATVEKALTALCAAAAATSLLAVATRDARWLAGTAAALGAIVVSDAALYRWFLRERGWWFALRAVPMRIVYYAANALSATVGCVAHVAARGR